MHKPDFLNSISRKFILISSGIIISLSIVFFIWQKNKYRIVKEKLTQTIAKKTDHLYSIRYDSIYFNELSGKAYMKNIHIAPDTLVIKTKNLEDLPYVLLDIRIASLRVSGVKTDKALWGKQLIGDSVTIDHGDVIVYFVKPLEKRTLIEAEFNTIYDEILGNLKSIQVGQVLINDVNVNGREFFTKKKTLDIMNSNLQLSDVFVDSIHNFDSSRTLFCKQVALDVASVIGYNNNRAEVRADKLAFSGKDKSLSFDDITINRFETEKGDSSRLLHGTNISIKGLNTNAIIYNKDLIFDTITCKHIILYQSPVATPSNPNKPRLALEDSTGFKNVYSIDMKHLYFSKIDFKPMKKNGFTVGNITLEINQVKADKIIKVQKNLVGYSKEVELICDEISANSKDGFYNYSFKNTVLNSLHRQLKTGSIIIKPFLSEEAFATKAHFQKDRYDIVLSGILLKNLDIEDLLHKKITSSGMLINNASVKIYCDLQKPMNGKSKVGNYASQIIKKIDIPVHIAEATVSNAFIQYREKEILSDSTGTVKFTESLINIKNITNDPEIINRNNAMKISFETKALAAIPVKGSFTFFLNSTEGKFTADGHVSSFDAPFLNEVSVPIGLIRLNAGTIHSLDFSFTGDNLQAGGKLLMKYNDLKVDVLKRDRKSNSIKKKGIKSLLANIIVKNDNPRNGQLLEVNPRYDRDIQRSFFNLIWKTIFTGMKKTAGVP